MALTRSARQTIIERAHKDPVFCKALLKELLRLAVASDPELLEKAVARVEKKTEK
jgi:hypothetical protein